MGRETPFYLNRSPLLNQFRFEKSKLKDMKRNTGAAAIVAAVFAILCGCVTGSLDLRPAVAQEAPNAGSPPPSRPQACSSYADCPRGMICAGAGGGATGSCMWPGQMPRPRPAYDPLPKGYLGSIYGHPIIQWQPPAGAPPSDAGGVWNMKDGTYRPPRGGTWAYRRGGSDAFEGTWVYAP
jgi:hypothetical protein